jgi:hypothetical protein
MASNEPKVLVEFDPEELKWLADRLHEEWQRSVIAKALVDNNKVEDNKKMATKLLNRMLGKASEQGFGDL